MLNSLKDRSSFGGYIRLGLRFFQFVLAITVIGLYAIDLDRGHKSGLGYDKRWTFAVVVGALSAISVFFYLIRWTYQAAWDIIMFILWTTVFGIFAKLYVNYHPRSGSPHTGDVTRMKNAVWVDLTNMLLWLITLIWNVVLYFTRMDKRTLHTGRATV